MIHAGSVASREPFSDRLVGLASLGEMLSDISGSFMRPVSRERLRNPSGSFRVGCGCARKKADHGDKERGADDGPDNRKLHFAEFQYEKLWQRQNTSQPHTEQGANETKCDRHQSAAARVAANGHAKRSANCGDEQENDEVEDCHGLAPFAKRTSAN